jgi:flagellar assembly factor FliW
MPDCQTTYFGALQYEEDSAIDFPQGLPGFAGEQRFLPVELPQHHPLIFLQSLVTPSLCFPTLPAVAIEPGYRAQFSAGDLEALGLHHAPAKGDVLCLVVIAISEDTITANLLAPVVVSPAMRRGVQSIQDPRRYSHQHVVKAKEVPEEVAACS